MISNAQHLIIVRQQAHRTCQPFAAESFVNENRIREYLVLSMLARWVANKRQCRDLGEIT